MHNFHTEILTNSQPPKFIHLNTHILNQINISTVNTAQLNHQTDPSKIRIFQPHRSKPRRQPSRNCERHPHNGLVSMKGPRCRATFHYPRALSFHNLFTPAPRCRFLHPLSEMPAPEPEESRRALCARISGLQMRAWSPQRNSSHFCKVHKGRMCLC